MPVKNTVYITVNQWKQAKSTNLLIIHHDEFVTSNDGVGPGSVETQEWCETERNPH